MPDKFSPGESFYYRNEYETGLSIQEIADRHDKTPTYIYYRLIKARTNFRPAGRPRKH